MVYAALTAERELRAYYLRQYHDCDIALATATRVVRGCFLENTANAGQYHQTARDTASRQVAGVAIETIPQVTGNTGTTWDVKTHSIRVSCRGIGVFPVATAAAVQPDTTVFVDGTADGNVLTNAGNIQVGRTICSCRVNGELDPLSTTFAWVDYDPKKY